MRVKVITIFLIVLLALSMAWPVLAKDKESRVISLGTMVVQGSVQKPNAFFVNGRSTLQYERPDVKESFLKEVIKPLRSKTF